MNTSITKKTIATSIGFEGGFILFDLLSNESIDWAQAIFVGILTALGLRFFNKRYHSQ